MGKQLFLKAAVSVSSPSPPVAAQTVPLDGGGAVAELWETLASRLGVPP